MDHTGEQNIQSVKSYEFTPIGYIKEKQNNGASKRPNESPIKESMQDTFRNESPPRKVRRTSIDDAMNSRMFNDSMQFDDTLPELDVNLQSSKLTSINMNKKNLIKELKENSNASNPLKEQQEQLSKLTTENYNLKLKCNSLLKVLNNVTDQGELRKSLEFLDEIEEWKSKYSTANSEFNLLKIKYDDLVIKFRNLESKVDEQESEVEDHTRCIIERDNLQNKIDKLSEELGTLNDKLDTITKELIAKDELIASNEEDIKQLNSHIDTLKNTIRGLEETIIEKDDNLKKQKDEIKTLNNNLNDSDHLGSEFLLLQNKLKEKNSQISVLENNLIDSKNTATELKTRLENLQKEYDDKLREKINQIHKLDDNIKQLKSERDSKYVSLDTNDKVRKDFERMRENNANLDSKLSQISNENKLFRDKISKLSNQLDDTKRERDNQVELMKRRIDEIITNNNRENSIAADKSEEIREKQEAHINELQRKLNDTLKVQTLSISTVEDKFKAEILKTKKELEENAQKLQKSEELVKELKRQVIENTTNASERNSKRLETKDKEINLLKNDIIELKNKINSLEKDSKLEDNNLREYYTNKIRQIEEESLNEKVKLEREIFMLKSERDTLIESNKHDINFWKSKCNSLEKQNEALLSQENEGFSSVNLKLNQRLKELDELLNQNNTLKKDNMELTRKLSKSQILNEEYKVELRKAVADLDMATKEYQKSKDFTKIRGSDDSNFELDNMRKNLLIMKTKYNNIKKDYLTKLSELQEENLQLEKKLSMNQPTSRSSDNAAAVQQDRIDYYRLKYHNEVKSNNDLKVMNEYLNRVLMAGSQQIRLDLLKLKEEMNLNDYNYSNFPNRDYYNSRNPYESAYDFRFVNNSHNIFENRHRKKFKTIALLVKACVRMKNTAIKRRWDEQRINYLQRKIAVDDNRITW
ncbi:hypothetical protein Kpol_1031p15 [Vanderwaltozyma polyspora DSM 70294]|uniref:Spindle pole body component 110 n=1 Tax=Vanderwaltozyma polyspora (strain ATCC 22028 / DSM 70294 / BCRC 21397 / CBS 2163 / NBRC 10782 / NRRL Y-8283 / UCD 57-17) TaxID=436907 RepID=SP110_VANPO|nr:uncharacterized protein Kpol_1031p15 [Vanderwaltozyma polyspora DSM 70294]A7THU9.1 RecName: Full=Spindle pole body component 110; AltName: Full=Spindle pole body spacer protein SPC110 [Vanderwaltozyma polyspora DSM 70294]EDO18111.1 hypothetical protein Kpol_1031p15 [Vanderwaltozyma polyspora DSM 70294]